MDLSSRVKLNNGVEVPYLGLGMFESKDGEEAYNAAKWALETGYRHIDTAMIYGNEDSVGKAIKDSGIPRNEIFVTTKLWNEDMRQGKQLTAIDESLARLGLDYVDLYLIHWPVRNVYVESWKKMEEIYKSGKAKAVGISNFNIHHIEDIMAVSDLVPAVNQCECSPELTQVELADYCAKKGILFEPWAPLGKAETLKRPEIIAMAGKYGKTPAQVVLRWGLQRGFINIPKSSNKSRIQENAGIFDFELDNADYQALFTLDSGKRYGPDPETWEGCL
ncbi:MAG: aldo/keto reductase [Treponema sp.]|nr:aldo/keto reductase [Treponema sp.]